MKSAKQKITKSRGSLVSLKKKAWKYASLVLRQSSADHRGMCTCYTCGAVHHWTEMQAGHAIGGRHNAVLLDYEILRVQCVGCNIFKRGNYQIFITKLIQENGFDWWTKKLEASKQIVKITRDFYENFIEESKQRLSELEAA